MTPPQGGHGVPTDHHRGGGDRLALLGGGSALAANAGLFDGDQPDGAGTLPAVSTLDASPPGDDTAPPAPSPTNATPSSAADDEDADRPSDDEAGEGTEVEDDD